MIVPTADPSDQVTPVVVVPLTDAVNCWPRPAVRLAVSGETATEIGVVGVSVTTAEVLTAVSVVEVAVTVTCCEEVIVAGAV